MPQLRFLLHSLLKKSCGYRNCPSAFSAPGSAEVQFPRHSIHYRSPSNPIIAKRELRISEVPFLAERVGFEPTVAFEAITGFQGQLLKPLGHLSILFNLVYFSGKRRELQERTLQNSLLQPSLKVLETQEKWLFLFQMERSFSRPPRYDHFGNSPDSCAQKRALQWYHRSD